MLANTSKLVQMKYLQVGKGRLGNLIAQSVKASTNLTINYARIDPEFGLINSNRKPIGGDVDQLVLCLSPSQSSVWQWDQILNGMIKQVVRNELKINQLIFISSTRVYDGITGGIITAETPVNAASKRAMKLLKAEHHIEQLTSNYHILRCSGLYAKTGQDYRKYPKILVQKDDKIRFGVDIEYVTQVVVEKLKENTQVSTHSLLTDGYCYFNGEKIAAQKVSHLSGQHRLLINSQVKL